MSATFDTLGLSPETLGALRRARFEAPTPIQSQAVPPALAGRDVIGCAATGTGKTAAYLLPLVERLGRDAEEAPSGRVGPVKGLVLAPTRELAAQIAEQAAFFGEPRGVTHAALLGGSDVGGQLEALRESPTLVIATPGRLVDLLQSGAVTLGAVRMLVLDEADRMLEMGFRSHLEQVLAALPREHQTLLFSATLGHDVTKFAQEALRKPVRVEVTPSGTPAARASQRLYEVHLEEKLPLLLTLLEADQLATLIFTRTRQRADRVHEVLKEAGHKVGIIHSDRTQGQRRQALEAFRRGKYRCLVATDIASRGLDVEDVGHVINFDLPYSPEDYVHRIGRTARAGASGRASSFVIERDEDAVRAIENVMRITIPRARVPRDADVFQEALDTYALGDTGPSPDTRERPIEHPRPTARRGTDRRGTDRREREAPSRARSERPAAPSRREREAAPRARSERPAAPSRRGRAAPAREGERTRGAGDGRGRTAEGHRPRNARGGPGKGGGAGRNRTSGKSRPGGGGGRGAGASRGAPPRGRGGGGRRGR